MENYHKFSKIYDDLMDPTYYDKWLAYTKANLPSGGSLLELGCGSGRLALKLAEDGFEVTGLDKSTDMLALARKRQEEAGQDLHLIQGDMLDLTGFGQEAYDHVVSFNDSLCYLRDGDQVQQTFDQVYGLLKPGGHFLFDIHSLKKIENFIGFSYHGQTEDGVLIWDSYAGDHDYSIEHDLSIFIDQGDSIYERYDERHYERTYPYEEVAGMLAAAGFTSVELTSDFSEDFDELGDRWFFKAVK